MQCLSVKLKIALFIMSVLVTSNQVAWCYLKCLMTYMGSNYWYGGFSSDATRVFQYHMIHIRMSANIRSILHF